MGATFPLSRDEDGTPLHPLTGARMVETSPGIWQDPIGVMMDKLMADAAYSMVQALQRDLQYPWLRKFKSPWGKGKGHNPHKYTFPEPEPHYCDECGRPYDE